MGAAAPGETVQRRLRLAKLAIGKLSRQCLPQCLRAGETIGRPRGSPSLLDRVAKLVGEDRSEADEWRSSRPAP
jgi:hypothetical protein